MRVLQVYRSLNTKVGGPARSIPDLSRELTRIGCETSILTFDNGGPSIADSIGSAKIILTRLSKNEMLSTIFCAHTSFKKIHEKFDIIHLHGIWPLLNCLSFRWANKNNTPVVVSPAASLQCWELNESLVSQVKKRIAWTFYSRKILMKSHAVNVTSKMELDSIKNSGIPFTSALIPIGINLNEFGNLPPLNKFYELYPNLKNHRILLFVSRLHPKKGLFMLAKAWGKLALEFPEWHLLIVGPDEKSHRKKIEKILSTFNVEKSYTFTGHLIGDARLSVYGAADLFVLPSFSENFGIVVPEALYSGIPVITTTETPWINIEKEHCGWIIPPETNKLEKILRKSMAMPSNERMTMGLNGKRLVEREYDSGYIARRMKTLYEWILNRQPKPDFVSFNKKGINIKLPLSRPRNLY
jgi:glycosyltransferase involved in cell wall biosynthesis